LEELLPQKANVEALEMVKLRQEPCRVAASKTCDESKILPSCGAIFTFLGDGQKYPNSSCTATDCNQNLKIFFVHLANPLANKLVLVNRRASFNPAIAFILFPGKTLLHVRKGKSRLA
jgi:hypothetical protein